VRVTLAGPLHAELTDLVVAAPFRGRRNGRLLLRAAALVAAERGARFIELSSDDDGAGALHRWYRDAGFLDCGPRGTALKRFRADIGALMSRLG
jgi:ribosomal protein S18 acetylase RimI-like enzyme